MLSRAVQIGAPGTCITPNSPSDTLQNVQIMDRGICNIFWQLDHTLIILLIIKVELLQLCPRWMSNDVHLHQLGYAERCNHTEQLM